MVLTAVTLYLVFCLVFTLGFLMASLFAAGGE